MCRHTIRKITHQAGWRWLKARKVLTSTDPEYSEKVWTLRSTLASLQADEAFFSIGQGDEHGDSEATEAIRLRTVSVLMRRGE